MPIKDFVEEWIEMRATLSRKLARLKSGEVQADDAITKATVTRLEAWLRELNTLLKDYSSVHLD